MFIIAVKLKDGRLCDRSVYKFVYLSVCVQDN